MRDARDSIRYLASSAGYDLTDTEVEAIIVKSLDTIDAKRLAIQEASRAYEDYVIKLAAEASGRPPRQNPFLAALRQRPAQEKP